MFCTDNFKRTGQGDDIIFKDNNTFILGGKDVTIYAHRLYYNLCLCKINSLRKGSQFLFVSFNFCGLVSASVVVVILLMLYYVWQPTSHSNRGLVGKG